VRVDCQQELLELRRLLNNFQLPDCAARGLAVLVECECNSEVDRASVHLLIGDAFQWQRRISESEEQYQHARELFASMGQAEGEWQARIGLGVIQHFRGNFGHARHIAEEGLDAGRRMDWDWVRARGLYLLGRVHHTMEEEETALAHFEEAREAFDQVGAVLEAAEISAIIGGELARLGRPDEARRTIKEAHVLFQKHKHMSGLCSTFGQLGLLYWQAGNFEGARKVLRDRLELTRYVTSRPQHVISLYLTAVAELACGNYEPARSIGTQAIELARSDSMYGYVCSGHMVLALALIHLGQPAAALNHAILSRDNMRQDLDAEAQLIWYYTAIAYLAAGFLNEAQQTWGQRPRLKLSRDNAVEAILLVRALQHIEGAKFWCGYDDPEPALRTLAHWRDELEHFRRLCPPFMPADGSGPTD